MPLADVAFVEHAASAARARSFGAGTRVIALSAEAMNALDEAGVPYGMPEDYVSSKDLNRAGIAAYDHVLAYCRALDAWLADRLPQTAAIAPAAASFYELKILHDAVTLRAMELDAIVRAERPSRVHAARPQSDPPGSGFAFRAESVFSRLIETRGMPVEWWEQDAAPIAAPKQQRSLKSMVPAEWRQRLSLFRSAGIRGLSVSSSAAAHETVLLLNITPDIRAAMQSPAAEGLRFVHWQGSGQPLTVRPLRVRGDVRISRAELLPGPRDAAPAGIVDASLMSVVQGRLNTFVNRDVPQMIAAASDARKVVEHYKPGSAIAGIVAGPRTRGAAAGVRAAGVPLTLCQHGGSYGYIDHPIHYFNDLMQADHFITYGKGVTADLAARYGTRRPVAEMTSAGSALLATAAPSSHATRAARRQPLGLDARPVVLYVATCLMGQRFYAPHYRSCEYFELLTAAARALASIGGVQVVLKTHQRGDNAFNPIEAWCRRHAPSIRVVSTGGLDPWLDVAEAVAIDLPGTPLLEALAHRVPVLAYLPGGTFGISAAGESMLRAAVTLETSRAAFLEQLARLPHSASLGDAGAFLEAYGTNAHAAEALARAITPLAGARA